jgi:hypothetical protein
VAGTVDCFCSSDCTALYYCCSRWARPTLNSNVQDFLYLYSFWAGSGIFNIRTMVHIYNWLKMIRVRRCIFNIVWLLLCIYRNRYVVSSYGASNIYIMWNLWKKRNRKIFYSKYLPNSATSFLKKKEGSSNSAFWVCFSPFTLLGGGSVCSSWSLFFCHVYARHLVCCT